ncbi:hypothetical protein LTR15_011301 [Elasticomyces elasticus]|nr:hypothetical protein LTR15_011301 [Elasticomyces elasticus]
MEPSALLRLPAELRNRIYELALYQEGGIVMRKTRRGWLWKRRVTFVPDTKWKSTIATARSLQLVCKSTSVDCRSLFWALNTFLLSCDVSPPYSAKPIAKNMRTPHEFLAWLSQRHTPVIVRGLVFYIGKGPNEVALPILSDFAKSVRQIDVQCELEWDTGQGHPHSRIRFPVLRFGAVFMAAAHFARTSMRESAVLDSERQFTEILAQALEGAAEYWSGRGIGNEEMVDAMAVAQRWATWSDYTVAPHTMAPIHQTLHLEHLLLLAYNNLHLQTIHSISAFRQLALRHTFTILQQPSLPLEDHALIQGYAAKIANSFLDTYDGLLWPDAPLSQWRLDQKARRRERWSKLRKYFEVLLQIPAASPVDEVLEKLAGVGRTRADSAPAKLGGKEEAKLLDEQPGLKEEAPDGTFEVSALTKSLDAKEHEEEEDSHGLEAEDDDWDESVFKKGYRKENIVSLPPRIDPTEPCGFLIGVDEDFQDLFCAVKCLSPLVLQMHREDVHHVFDR